ncbi:zf-ZPR1-domain-containing protein [Multifurca ochricompacta]|uniref:Zf-ZPR1-domain-containing protein n=1 Tax=Multifurca ochricompacta TaxID=376703 RepID=A0AAD4QRD2_9AGAM|nr:zf-ZPR1-domain-containing protein [Multifurca ochricompacta]
MAVENLFPSIGTLAQQADDAEDVDKDENAIDASEEDEGRVVQEIESFCVNCEKQGITRLLLTHIPYFHEVIVMSFRCEHCGSSNNEIQSAGVIRPEGVIYTARILSRQDLNRQIVKSETCTVTIPEYELTIPASKGQLTTVEGIIQDVIRDLSYDQPLRRIQDEDTFIKIKALIDKLKAIISDEDEDGEGSAVLKEAASSEAPMPPFTLKLDDPAGNSFIEFVESMADPKWNLRTYRRTKEQNVTLGLVASDDLVVGEGGNSTEIGPTDDDNEEIYIFPGVCSSCGHPLDTMMKKIAIPYFKDILIMSTNCDRCGYRDNEVKSGTAISEKGKRITLRVEDREDLSRDVLKSETAGLTIPEIELVLQAGTLGGRFTTLEGILEQVYEELSEKVFAAGDSVGSANPDGPDFQEHNKFESFLKKLKEVKNAERPFTLILDDPLANSYVQNLYAPDPDPNMEIELYDRTWEQNEGLGLNDMKVEGYEQGEDGGS